SPRGFSISLPCTECISWSGGRNCRQPGFLCTSGRKIECEGHAASWRTSDVHLPAVFPYDPEHDGQAQPPPDARGFRCEERIKDARQDRIGNSGPIVADFEQSSAVARPHGAKADGAASAPLFYGLARITDQVQQHLLELPGISENHGQADVQILLD